MRAKSFAAMSSDKPLEFYEFDRREPTEFDVEIRILFSGVCHSDLHTARGDWGDTEYPCVTGHEIIGEVTRVGSGASKHKIGDIVGVGVMVNSCRECKSCLKGLEQYCESGITLTYSSQDPIDGTNTKGGYSDLIVVQENFVLKIPNGLDISKAAPLLCAGITLYSPLRHWNAGPQSTVGIIGLGGLGHMGVKFSKALGAETHVITSSPNKDEAARAYGADGVIVSSSKDSMDSVKGKFDLLIDTVPVEHDLSKYLDLLSVDGTIVLVGPINPMPSYHAGQLIGGRKAISGSAFGGIKETQEMLDFCADNNILPDVEMINIEKINEAWNALEAGSVANRFVIDIEQSFC